MKRKILYTIPFALILTLSFVLAASEKYTDLAIIDIKITPENPKVGDYVEGVITVQNLGDVRIKMGFSADVEFPGGGYGMGAFGIKLRPGEVKTIPVNFEVKEKGFYQISASAYSNVYDKNPENNKASLKILVE